MVYFMRMIETLRHDGLLFAGNATRFSEDGTRVVEADRRATLRTLDADEWELITRAQPFVFHADDLPDHGIEQEPQEKQLTKDAEENFDPPFPVFAVERFGGPLGLLGLDNAKIEIYCICVFELAPKKYQYYCLVKRPQDGSWVVSRPDSHIAMYVDSYLERMKTEKTGIESTRGKVKIGSGKNKRFHQIRRVVHVSPKRYIAQAEAALSRVIDWSHRFEVRGHWREHTGKLGKDREGNYCIKDWTWVTNHVRGPEHLPLIKKTRVVE